jgi:hypothetical protein
MRADSLPARVRGLLGRDRLEPGQAMLIKTTGPIHTWFMRFSIDVLFLDRNNVVVGLRQDLSPFRFAWCRNTAFVLELTAGTIGHSLTTVDDALVIA